METDDDKDNKKEKGSLEPIAAKRLALPVVRVKLIYVFKGGYPSTLWGPSAWTFKHSVALQNNVSPESEATYYQLTKENLPCTICEQAYKKFILQHPYKLNYAEDDSPPQLAQLFHQCHNNINKEQGQRVLSYQENLSKFEHLDPTIWLLGLIDYLLALALHQISSHTEIYTRLKKVSLAEKVEFNFSNLLPIHKLVYFLLTSKFLSSIENKHVDKFIELASTGKTSLLAIKLYDLKNLRRKKNLPYLAKPFVKRLQRILNRLYPNGKKYQLENRVKLFFS